MILRSNKRLDCLYYGVGSVHNYLTGIALALEKQQNAITALTEHIKSPPSANSGALEIAAVQDDPSPISPMTWRPQSLYYKPRASDPAIRRAIVAPEAITWDVPDTAYSPLEYVTTLVMEKSRESNDCKSVEMVALLHSSLAHRKVPFAIDVENGRPLVRLFARLISIGTHICQNPRGRTGVSGRGALWSWGYVFTIF